MFTLKYNVCKRHYLIRLFLSPFCFGNHSTTKLAMLIPSIYLFVYIGYIYIYKTIELSKPHEVKNILANRPRTQNCFFKTFILLLIKCSFEHHQYKGRIISYNKNYIKCAIRLNEFVQLFNRLKYRNNYSIEILLGPY